jgi:hypothetical protein
MNNRAYERFVLLVRLASEQQNLEEYHDIVDELNAILLGVLQEKGATVSHS